MTDTTTGRFALDADAYRGFTTAVRNGQVRLALEYAIAIIAEQQERITALENAQQSEPAKAASSSSSTSSTRGGRRRRQEVTDEGPPDSESASTSTAASGEAPPSSEEEGA